MSSKKKEWYLGLDCGTDSVGWAVTDSEYHLLRARGQTLWGVRLFDEAQTAADRRLHRTARRRYHRRHQRLQLLNLLFEEEIAKVDPEFYLRLKKSFLLEEDKNLKKNSKNTLFNDKDFSDKDYHQLFPTIWHLRQAIIEQDKKFTTLPKSIKIRLYYLAIHHILKNRGHFLLEGEFQANEAGFEDIYNHLVQIAANYDLYLDKSQAGKIEGVIKNKLLGKRDKAKQLKDIFNADNEDTRLLVLANLLAGSKAPIISLFASETEGKPVTFSFDDGNFEDKIGDWESEIGAERMDLILAAKQIYDYGILKNLLGEHKKLSEAMVANYEQHQEDLLLLKAILDEQDHVKRKKEKVEHTDAYREFFIQTKVSSNKVICYNAYLGKAYTQDKQGRKSYYTVSQEEVNKYLENVLAKYQTPEDIMERARRRELLPKQKGQAKGTIPQQLHKAELVKILASLTKDFPDFARENKKEKVSYNTKAKKILQLHQFRIPYYCGPIVKRAFDNDGHAVKGGKSQFSWLDEEISQLVYPWNFADLVPLEKQADNFIRRMTNSCTYLLGEDVLPAASLLYQRYVVLNELNNLKLNGSRLADVKVKQRIFDEVFLQANAGKNVTIKTLNKYCRENNLIGSEDVLSGALEIKTFPKLSTHLSLLNILGKDYEHNFSSQKLEEVIELVTILGNEPKILEPRICQILGEDKCNGEQAKKISRQSFNEWGRFSKKFLTGLKATVQPGKQLSIIEALWETNLNLMELLSDSFGFMEQIKNYNAPKLLVDTGISYEQVKRLYFSPAVKRSVWQALQIVQELIRVMGCLPTKIFIESTRTNDPKAKNKMVLSRHNTLIENYKKITSSAEAKELLKSLESRQPRDLQKKKLYLYYTQMGKCAYCGEKIHLSQLDTNNYDIDHIYPRALTKDDSITRNLVLCCRHCNAEKKKNYPIADTIRFKQQRLWQSWSRAQLITKDKYERLMRATPLTDEELAGFIARQIVETSQSVKAIRDLLQNYWQETKVILVKASQVSDMRHYFAGGYKKNLDDKDYTYAPMPEFIKLRDVNDFHHAKDAYLNIVVGNVMSLTFTDKPYYWLKEHPKREYSLNSRNIWRRDADRAVSFIKGWQYDKTVQIVSQTLKRNDVLCTRKTEIVGGPLYDLQIVGKSTSDEGLLPIKKGLDAKKYGGYNSIKSAYFALIDIPVKNEKHRRIVQVPIYAQKQVDDYLRKVYPEAQMVYEMLPINALLRINGNYMRLSGRTGKSIILAPAQQLLLDGVHIAYLKKVSNLQRKFDEDKKYQCEPEFDGVTQEKNQELFEYLLTRVKTVFGNMPLLGMQVDKFWENKDKFAALLIQEQCLVFSLLLIVFKCNTATADLSFFIKGTNGIGKCIISSDIGALDEVLLIQQSPTGLYQKVIDLKSVKAKK
ncbi:type II CRISPR RNA-guided endonuclease Cas9 [bacterium]|nr:type II CRISPR RNA-guided endonuclease Cas9 [bacterium]